MSMPSAVFPVADTLPKISTGVRSNSALTPAVRFALVAVGPVTLRPLKLVGIADIIDIFATLDEALSALSD